MELNDYELMAFQTLDMHFFQNVNGVEVSLPVGNSDLVIRVVAVTTLIVSGATCYLMVSLFRKPEIVKIE